MKYKLVVALLLLCFQVDAQKVRHETQPCKLDTSKGLLFYRNNEGYNNGNSWDTGYVVAKCGALGIPSGKVTFIPAQFIVIRDVKEVNAKNWHKEISIVGQEKIFYNSDWQPISNNMVYGLVILK